MVRTGKKRRLIGALGLCFILFALAPSLSPYDPLQVDPGNRLQTMSKDHLLGTDHLGRDVLSRILEGAYTTVGISLIIMGMVLLIGVPAGLISGYFGGLIDRMFMRVTDAVMAFPDFIVAIVLSGLLGPGMLNLMWAIVLVKWTSYARLVRSTVLTEKKKDYMKIAALNGVPGFKAMRKHLLPHVAGHVLVLCTLDLGKVILMIAALSYIGLGAQPPSPEWGAMLNDGRAYFHNAPHLMYIPGFAIVIVVLMFNLAGDHLRDRFDVKKEGA
ncbi:nickel transporter permease [Bacillus sp. KH172YL63]|uniref:nickel transporter permease n=1 Tax=Bacillus sp. KH172YL63 TaxID=2709784 RepID=UPI0013E467B9|nr:nickel transporter permease [Bacillus sp. KH172YL63]BCB05274.1 glutathione ABC transporter permease GsiD [Bacillus sp. KH172YL63]